MKVTYPDELTAETFEELDITGPLSLVDTMELDSLEVVRDVSVELLKPTPGAAGISSTMTTVLVIDYRKNLANYLDNSTAPRYPFDWNLGKHSP